MMTFEDFVMETANAGNYDAYADLNGSLVWMGKVSSLFDSNPSWHERDVEVMNKKQIVFYDSVQELEGCEYEE
jgi:hypothetical protein